MCKNIEYFTINENQLFGTFKRVVQGSLSWAEKLTHHELLLCPSRVTRNMCVTDHEEYFFKITFRENTPVQPSFNYYEPHKLSLTTISLRFSFYV